jgi:gamma-glutamylcyclotransferase (GGCT)/AIG2-like uncharacterized protein YtfP
MSEKSNINQTVYPNRLFVHGTLKRGGWNHDRFSGKIEQLKT